MNQFQRSAVSHCPWLTILYYTLKKSVKKGQGYLMPSVLTTIKFKRVMCLIGVGMYHENLTIEEKFLSLPWMRYCLGFWCKVQIDRQIDIQTDRQTDRQDKIDKEIRQLQVDGQTNTQLHPCQQEQAVFFSFNLH